MGRHGDVADHGHRNSKLILGKRRDAEIQTLLEMFRTEKSNSAREHSRLRNANGNSALETDKRLRVLKTKSLIKRSEKSQKENQKVTKTNCYVFRCLTQYLSLSRLGFGETTRRRRKVEYEFQRSRESYNVSRKSTASPHTGIRGALSGDLCSYVRVCLAFSNLQATIRSCACVSAMNRLLEAWVRHLFGQLPQIKPRKKWLICGNDLQLAKPMPLHSPYTKSMCIWSCCRVNLLTEDRTRQVDRKVLEICLPLCARKFAPVRTHTCILSPE